MTELIKDFLLGASAPYKGFQAIRNSKKLRKKMLMPLSISIGIFTVILVLLTLKFPEFNHWLLSQIKSWVRLEMPSFMAEGAWQAIGRFFQFILSSLVLLISFIMATLLSWVISTVVCSIFWEFLAEETLFGHLNLPRPVLARRSALHLLRTFFGEMAKEGLLVLLAVGVSLLSFFPWIGPFISLSLAPLVVAIILGFSFIDYGMSVVAWPLSKRWKWVQKHWAFLLGLGIYGLVFPVLFFLYPAFVVGALLTRGQSLLKS